jgi:hypothetical protein
MHASYQPLAADNDSLPAVIELAERSPLFEPHWAPTLTYRTVFPMVEGFLK